MKVVTEFVKFDDEDRGNIDYEGGEYPYGIHRAEKDHMFFLCYYTPENQDNIVVPGEGNSKRSKFSFLRILILCLFCQAPVGLPKTSSRTWVTKAPPQLASHLAQIPKRSDADAGKPTPGKGGGGVKPGSHMPRSYLRHDSDTAAGAACDTVPIWEQKSPATEAMSILTAGIPAKLSRVRLGRHAGGKDLRCFLSRRRYVLICRSSVAGSICGYVTGTLAAYENQPLFGLKLLGTGICRRPLRTPTP